MKPGATVALKVGDKPLLVSGAHGKGKVAVWLGAPLGDPPANTTPYWESPGWPGFLQTFLKTMTTPSPDRGGK